MDIQVTRWENKETLSEGVLMEQFSSEGLKPYRWSNAPHDTYDAHTHDYHKVIYVMRGSITFELPEKQESITLYAGDRMDLPMGIIHSAVVGQDGVVCLEAHRFD